MSSHDTSEVGAELAAAREHTVRTADGRTLLVREVGDPQGTLVVVHHGTPGSGVMYPSWAADATARGIRLVCADRAGYGGSDRARGRTVADVAADTATVADALGAPTFRTWGYSGGGPHALACAALLPDRVTSVATLGGVAPFSAEGLDWSAGMGQDNLDEFGAAVAGEAELRAYLEPAAEGLLSIGPVELGTEMASLVPPADVAVLERGGAAPLWSVMTTGLAPGVDGWLDDDLAFVRPWGFDLTAITVPVLLVHGGTDLMVPAAHGSWLAARVPSATTAFDDAAGHLGALEDIAPVHEWLLAHQP